jgi:hypothetical protein
MEQSICSRADFHASRLAAPESNKAEAMTVISGLKCLESFVKPGPGGFWRKMFLTSLLSREDWFSTECALTWKMKVTRCNRSLYQLAVSTPRTKETDCGLWATPRASDAKKDGNVNPLEPRNGLPGMARARWPAPTNSMMTEQDMGQAMYAGNGAKRPKYVDAAMWSTPAANDAKNATLPESQRLRDTLPGDLIRHRGRAADGSPDSTEKPDVSLNPKFVLWLQGYPATWLD